MSTEVPYMEDQDGDRLGQITSIVKSEEEEEEEEEKQEGARPRCSLFTRLPSPPGKKNDYDDGQMTMGVTSADIKRARVQREKRERERERVRQAEVEPNPESEPRAPSARLRVGGRSERRRPGVTGVNRVNRVTGVTGVTGVTVVTPCPYPPRAPPPPPPPVPCYCTYVLRL